MSKKQILQRLIQLIHVHKAVRTTHPLTDKELLHLKKLVTEAEASPNPY